MEEMNLVADTEQVFAKQSDVRVFTSNQYDKFILSELNRIPGHYKKVLQSIKENDYTKYQPILVNSRLEIVDGQNRFLACKELGLPIHFIVSDEIQIFAAADINRASKNWTASDYAIHYAKRGREPYIKLLDLCARFNQKLSVVQCLGRCQTMFALTLRTLNLDTFSSETMWILKTSYYTLRTSLLTIRISIRKRSLLRLCLSYT